MIGAEKQQIVFAKPAFKLHKTAGGLRDLHLTRASILEGQCVHVHIGTVAAIAHCAGMRHALAMNVEGKMPADYFALPTIAFATW